MIKRFRVGSVFGIPVELDVTLLLVVPLIAWTIATDVTGVVQLLDAATGVRVQRAAVSAGAWPWILGSLGAAGLFLSVGLHELGHSVVALRRGHDIDAIELWFLGGVARFADQPDEWTDELGIAVAGPAVSVLLGAAGLGLLFAVPASVPRVRFLVGYLGVLNLVLAGFNLLPGFPMDGGRILRALLSRTRPLPEATELAATVGKVVAVGIGIAGILSLNLFLLAIAFFVYVGAAAESAQTKLRAAFEGTTVADLQTPAEAVETVRSDATVGGLLDRMYRQRHTGYPVVDDGRLRGIVTLEDVSGVDESEHDAVTVGSVMTSDLVTVDPDTPAFDALKTMEAEDVGRLLVTDESGAMVGLVSRSDLVTALAIARTTPRPGPLPSSGSGLPGD